MSTVGTTQAACDQPVRCQSGTKASDERHGEEQDDCRQAHPVRRQGRGIDGFIASQTGPGAACGVQARSTPFRQYEETSDYRRRSETGPVETIRSDACQIHDTAGSFRSEDHRSADAQAAHAQAVHAFRPDDIAIRVFGEVFGGVRAGFQIRQACSGGIHCAEIVRSTIETGIVSCAWQDAFRHRAVG